MIGLLRGEVAVRRADHVVILCGGVGYRAAVSAETLRHVPAVGKETTLHTHLIVRDDALSLYGFHSEQERDLFLMLLSVQAVGPKVALAVLSGGPPRELVATLAAGDAARLQAVPGHRQAHRRAHHRRAAREGRCRRRPGRCPRRRGERRRDRRPPRSGSARAGSRGAARARLLGPPRPRSLLRARRRRECRGADRRRAARRPHTDGHQTMSAAIVSRPRERAPRRPRRPRKR